MLAHSCELPTPDSSTVQVEKCSSRGCCSVTSEREAVCLCRWMRTTINFQYRYGMTTVGALKHLYAEGGIRYVTHGALHLATARPADRAHEIGARAQGRRTWPTAHAQLTLSSPALISRRRFYRGVGPALFQGPLSRFGDTAANAGMMALWDNLEMTKGLPTWTKTMSASAAAASFRVFLMPIDACKTILQVEGADGLQKLRAKVKAGGPGVLYHGSLGAMSATFVGHYPWFFTYNTLDGHLPKYDRKENLPMYLGRNALLGFCSSAVSDTCSNSIRVIKTTTQTSTVPIGYIEALKQVVAKDGISGLMFRGLVTKIIANGCQGIAFSVLWRLGQDYLNAKNEKKQ